MECEGLRQTQNSSTNALHRPSVSNGKPVLRSNLIYPLCIQATEENLRMSEMKVAIVPKAKADFEIIERDIPTPGPGEVRIKV